MHAYYEELKQYRNVQSKNTEVLSHNAPLHGL